MPRIGRNKVQFFVDGQEWRAVFKHEHANGKPIVVEGDRGDMKLTHVTTCFLGQVGVQGALSAGEARCSVRDAYDWRKGIKLSFERSLEVRGITRELDRVRHGKFMAEFFKEMRDRG